MGFILVIAGILLAILTPYWFAGVCVFSLGVIVISGLVDSNGYDEEEL